jgi:hypothetical protein
LIVINSVTQNDIIVDHLTYSDDDYLNHNSASDYNDYYFVEQCHAPLNVLYYNNIALTHDSPILFLNCPSFTINEKYAHVEDYLCGLQFFLFLMVLAVIVMLSFLLNHATILTQENMFMFP